MEFTNEKLSLEEGLKREWIITNGIGGYCSINNSRSKYKKISRIT